MSDTTKAIGITAVITGLGIIGWQFWPQISEFLNGGDGDDEDDGGGGDIPPATPSVAEMISVTATPANRTVQSGGIATLNVHVKNHTAIYTAWPAIHMIINLGSKIITMNPVEGETKLLALLPHDELDIQLSATLPSGWTESNIKWALLEISSGTADLLAQSVTGNDFLMATPQSLEILSCTKTASGDYVSPGALASLDVVVKNPTNSDIPFKIALELLIECLQSSTWSVKTVYVDDVSEANTTRTLQIGMYVPHWDRAGLPDVKDYGQVKSAIWLKKPDDSEVKVKEYPDTPSWIYIRGDDESQLEFLGCFPAGPDMDTGPGDPVACTLLVKNPYPITIQIGLIQRLGGEATWGRIWSEDPDSLILKRFFLPPNSVFPYFISKDAPYWDIPMGGDIADNSKLQCEIWTVNLTTMELRKLIVMSPIFTGPGFSAPLTSPTWIYRR